MAVKTLKTYRVWMKDGYASLHNAAGVSDAKRQAVKLAHDNLESCNVAPSERLDAITVDYVKCLNSR